MDHVEGLLDSRAPQSSELVTKLTGRYFTPPSVADEMVSQVVRLLLKDNTRESIHLVDPFAGDGRLLEHFMRSYAEVDGPRVPLILEAWDRDTKDLDGLKERLLQEFPQYDINLAVLQVDSFRHIASMRRRFDVVITNPPWELLKPDPRELNGMVDKAKRQYVSSMRRYADFLDKTYPDSKPAKKFAGWGTNLSRVGLDASLELLDAAGILGIVMPASLLADVQSRNLRRKLLTASKLTTIALYPAEAKLFGTVDIPCIMLTAVSAETECQNPVVTRYDPDLTALETGSVRLPKDFLVQNDYIIPLSQGNGVVSLMASLAAAHPPLADYQEHVRNFWMGREIDETRIAELASHHASALPFLRGRLINRFQPPGTETFKICPSNTPSSTQHERIAWRDISRPSQKRRMIATIIPAGSIAGNSLGIACFGGGRPVETRLLLGVLCSFVFEFQLKAHLATNHVSLSAIKKVRIPSLSDLRKLPNLAREVDRLLAEGLAGSPLLESIVAKQAYGLSEQQFIKILSHFKHLSNEEVMELTMNFRSLDASDAIDSRRVA